MAPPTSCGHRRCTILPLARLAALTLAIVLSALLVNAVGIIGFIGLFAPLLAKMLGARRLLARLLPENDLIGKPEDQRSN